MGNGTHNIQQIPTNSKRLSISGFKKWYKTYPLKYQSQFWNPTKIHFVIISM